MEKYWLERAELLVKPEGLAKLQAANVLVIGLGGVGSYAAEFIARAGVGRMTIVDGDVVDTTNRNRQLQALSSTIGMSKVDLMATRLQDINPDLQLTPINEFVTPERIETLVTAEFDYVVECIDSVTPKISVITTAKKKGVRIISSMGAGGKSDPSLVRVADVSKSYNDPLARTVRKYLHRKHRIRRGIKVVFSPELPPEGSLRMTDGTNFKKSFYGTISYMPALFGLMAAGEVIQYLINQPSS
jgi:tRNA A37 threonylcarbamoyladenosine dehydratase